MSGDLHDARAAELALRARLAEAITERTRARREAERLDGRAALPGADPALGEAAAFQRRLATRADAAVASLRAELRRAEGAVVTAEAEADADIAPGGRT